MRNLPYAIGFTQTESMTATASTTTTKQITVATGHGNVQGVRITPLSQTFAVLIDNKITLKNNESSFMLEENIINFSDIYQQGSDTRVRVIFMKEQSTFQITIDNSNVAALDVEVTLFFDERGKPRGNN